MDVENLTHRGLEEVAVYSRGLQIRLPLKLEFTYQAKENWRLLATAQIEQSLSNWINSDLCQVEQRPVLY
ncbi:MAG: hypothetical protein AAF849_07650 [Bacteroidota bacterium]